MLQLLLERVTTTIVFRTFMGCQHTLLMKMMVVLVVMVVKHVQGIHFLFSPSLFYVFFSLVFGWKTRA